MITLFTTEENLSNLCTVEGWHKVIKRQGLVVVTNNSEDEQWDETDPVLRNLHLEGVDIYVENSTTEDLKNKPSKVLDEINPVYILDIDEKTANDIETKYGVICKHLSKQDDIALISRGWELDTSDEDKPKHWKFFLEGIETGVNNILIVDRYFFTPERNKDDSSLDETIEDSIHNLRNILLHLIPQKTPEGMMQVTVVFDASTVEDEYTFSELATKVNKMKKSMIDFHFDLELISINGNCYRYKDTHDRALIANYYVVKATHKLKAFRGENTSLCDQNLFFDYLYSKGFEKNDKSSFPEVTQDRIINAIKESIRTSKNEIEYALNGQTSKRGNFEVKNRLLQEKD